ncbi:WD-40 repeat-containing protein [Calothrix sp. NIES-4071]|nr:WD-40 repeat-containing protein [Calothrix sp. NIES-4071]BAZ59530.1 WD-40 repeat-containing protein [Calothrix sp. NIES-4105]
MSSYCSLPIPQSPNDEALHELAWALQSSIGKFSLILARCNCGGLRSRLLESLQSSCLLNIQEIFLDKNCIKLYNTIQNSIGDEHPQALMINGLESVTAIDKVLYAANQVREEFRKNFHFPLVLWVTDEVLQKLIRLAPDLLSWTTSVEFTISTDDLIECVQKTTDEVFVRVLDAGAGRFLDNATLNLEAGSLRRVEFEFAWQELQKREITVNLELEASIEFVLGRLLHASMEKSRQHYERSLELWQVIEKREDNKFLERQGYLLYSLGLWWRTYAVVHRCEHNQACEQAKNYFQQSILVFERANRLDLVAKFINALGAVLQRLQYWQELETVAHKALTVYKHYPDAFKLARTYGFVAEVAISRAEWKQAKHMALKALYVFKSGEKAASKSVKHEMIADLDWEKSYHRGWYLFAASRAFFALGNVEKAINKLEQAISETKPQYDPLLYIGILGELRDCYFQKGRYLDAFHIKQQRRSIEQQYGFRAFMGAGRLQPKQQITNPSLPVVAKQESIAQEIVASGREQDINRLVERMGRPSDKLTIIYGQSGVGLSSILQAGLIPALKQKSIGTRDVVTVLQEVYTDWVGSLGKSLKHSLVCPLSFNAEPTTKYEPSDWTNLNSTKAIIEQLKKHGEYNLLTVLIFDQFEEFFFVYQDAKQRQPFYEFLRDCLDIPYVKVILSLREDYLHYLLECNYRDINFDVINNNILDKNIIYYLGNFSPQHTKTFIKTLTDKNQLLLEVELIDELVNDLARDLGEVRPIELQIIGTQLQNEQIKTVEQYRKYGPKEKLVGRFLEEIIKDCGVENEQIAKLILYLLTDEKNTCPLKIRADLESSLDVPSEKLDLVLEILVKSGLVSKAPAYPADFYQLAHDYLIPFVHEQQSALLITELGKEAKLRKLNTAKLNEALQQEVEKEAKLNELLKQQLETKMKVNMLLNQRLKKEAHMLLIWKVLLGIVLVAEVILAAMIAGWTFLEALPSLLESFM